MSAYREVQKLIALTLQLSPKVAKSELWQRARDKALRAAKREDIEHGDYSFLRPEEPENQEDHETEQDEWDPASLDETMTKILGRPPKYRK